MQALHIIMLLFKCLAHIIITLMVSARWFNFFFTFIGCAVRVYSFFSD